MPKRPLKIQYRAPWSLDLTLPDGTVISSNFSEAEADAVLCDWMPDEYLVSGSLPAIWYHCEPFWIFQEFPSSIHNQFRTRLDPARFIHHRHDDPALRVPHMTHHLPLTELKHTPEIRTLQAIAVVSNNTTPINANSTCATVLRNRMVTQKNVDLYGKRDAWQGHSRTLFRRQTPPKNYHGPIPSDDTTWHSESKRKLLRKYHVNICMENAIEENYFTEKFLEAVICGCVPVYMAHESVRDLYLRGATWIDPQDFGLDVKKTLRAAFQASRNQVAEQNYAWAKSNPAVQETRTAPILKRLATILRTIVEATNGNVQGK